MDGIKVDCLLRLTPFLKQLQQALEITRKDLAGASLDLQAELDRFQHEKIKDLRNMLIAYAKVHIQYCKQVSDGRDTMVQDIHECCVFRIWDHGKRPVLRLTRFPPLLEVA